jgi:hypothetical protein
MSVNIERYKRELEQLVALGGDLQNAMTYRVDPKEFERLLGKQFDKEGVKAFIAKLPPFNETYQIWYSQSIALIRQLLPDRLANFVSLYEKPKNRKILTADAYTVEDFLSGLERTDRSVTIASAIPVLSQQVAILNACHARFESSLFEIRQLVQADLFDSEIEAGRALLRFGFGRAAGAIAGVVIEKHLKQVGVRTNGAVAYGEAVWS